MPIKVEISAGLHCVARGSQELLDLLEDDLKIMSHCEVTARECFECCEQGEFAPVVKINGKIYSNIMAEELVDLLNNLIDQTPSTLKE